MVLSSDNGGYVKNDNGGCNTTSGMDGLPSTDSGHGGACFNGEAGANNFPLRAGSKRPTVSLETTRTRPSAEPASVCVVPSEYAMFEGGIRVNAFVSGGLVPAAVRGTKLDGMIHIGARRLSFVGLRLVGVRLLAFVRPLADTCPNDR